MSVKKCKIFQQENSAIVAERKETRRLVDHFFTNDSLILLNSSILKNLNDKNLSGTFDWSFCSKHEQKVSVNKLFSEFKT